MAFVSSTGRAADCSSMLTIIHCSLHGSDPGLNEYVTSVFMDS